MSIERSEKTSMSSQTPVAASGGGISPPPINPDYRPPQPKSVPIQHVLTTDTGDAIVRWPSVLSGEDYDAIERWLDGLKRKIKRSVSGESDGKKEAAI